MTAQPHTRRHDDRTLLAEARETLISDAAHETAKVMALRGLRRPAPLAALAAALAHDLVEAGFTLHTCTPATCAGGVCLDAAGDGTGVVTWSSHHAVAHDPERVCDDEFTRETMNYALAEILGFHGWHVRSFQHATAHVVTGRSHGGAA